MPGYISSPINDCDNIAILPSSLDIDECASADTNECHDNSTCVNTIGQYYCTCDEGFSGDGFDCQSKMPTTVETLSLGMS